MLISIYFSFMLNIKFWQFAFEKVEISNFCVAVFALSLLFFIFIPLFLFFNLIVWPRIGKPLVMILLILSAASDYALQNLGIVINSDMIRNILETNIREATDLITLHAVSYVLITGIVPAILVWRTTISFNSLPQEICQRLICLMASVLTICVIAAVSYKEYASFGRNNKQARYYINTFNYLYAATRYYKKTLDTHRKFIILDKSPEILPNITEKPRVLVLIVGETARAENFSLYGYKRPTNPLTEQNKDIIIFKNVTSCGTATAVSLPCMFSRLNRKDFDLSEALYMQNLLDIAKTAGYDVIWKDNDDGCKRVCDRVTKIDAKNGNKQPFCFGDYCYDEILTLGLAEQLKNITKDTLIVLHTMGSHGPAYYKRYPDAFKRFEPTCDTADLQNCDNRQIINTYDNTIVYTDYIIASIIEILKQNQELQSGMLYISDHGESLGENNIYLHGLPFAIAPEEQKKVPMLLFLSETAVKNLNLDLKCLRRQAATKSFSHDNYFDSVLRLLQIKTSIYNPRADIFTPCISKPSAL